MSFSYQALLFIHIAIGFISLILFWIPIVAKKGSALHVRTGHWYAKAMYVVGFSALILALMLMIDPISFKFPDNALNPESKAKFITQMRGSGLFLLAISILVLVGVRHGLQAVRAKRNQALMRRADNLIINLALLTVGIWLGINAAGGSPMSVLYYIFAGLCSVTAVNNLRFCLKHKVTRGEQIIAHIGGLVGAGIGSHTAFFVFGANRFLSELLSGYTAIIPWVLPGVIGTLIIFQQTKRYKPRKTISTA
jgi:hypothetical protein